MLKFNIHDVRGMLWTFTDRAGCRRHDLLLVAFLAKLAKTAELLCSSFVHMFKHCMLPARSWTVLRVENTMSNQDLQFRNKQKLMWKRDSLNNDLVRLP